MKNLKLINKIKTATSERSFLERKTLVLYQNITYYLINNYYAVKSKKVDDLDILYIFDNLYYNNEIIDNDNLQEYENILSTREINRIKKGEIILLNYYTLYGGYKECWFFLDSNYNVGF